jgi:hypothetical protein
MRRLAFIRPDVGGNGIPPGFIISNDSDWVFVYHFAVEGMENGFDPRAYT